jgi:hypothetical protein
MSEFPQLMAMFSRLPPHSLSGRRRRAQRALVRALQMLCDELGLELGLEIRLVKKRTGG